MTEPICRKPHPVSTPPVRSVDGIDRFPEYVPVRMFPVPYAVAESKRERIVLLSRSLPERSSRGDGQAAPILWAACERCNGVSPSHRTVAAVDAEDCDARRSLMDEWGLYMTMIWVLLALSLLSFVVARWFRHGFGWIAMETPAVLVFAWAFFAVSVGSARRRSRCSRCGKFITSTAHSSSRSERTAESR